MISSISKNLLLPYFVISPMWLWLCDDDGHQSQCSVKQGWILSSTLVKESSVKTKNYICLLISWVEQRAQMSSQCYLPKSYSWMPTEVTPSFPPYNGCNRAYLLSWLLLSLSRSIFPSRQHQQKLLTNWVKPCTLPYQIYPLTACLITVLVAWQLMKIETVSPCKSA